MNQKAGVPLIGVSESAPLMLETLPPVTRLITLVSPGVVVVKFTDSRGSPFVAALMLKL